MLMFMANIFFLSLFVPRAWSEDVKMFIGTESWWRRCRCPASLILCSFGFELLPN